MTQITFEQAKQKIAEKFGYTSIKPEYFSHSTLYRAMTEAAELWQAENLKEIERLKGFESRVKELEAATKPYLQPNSLFRLY